MDKRALIGVVLLFGVIIGGCCEEKDVEEDLVIIEVDDITVKQGEPVVIDLSGSYEMNGKELNFTWDVNNHVNTDNKNSTTDDINFIGERISYIYPYEMETKEYIITLNVSVDNEFKGVQKEINVMVMAPPLLYLSYNYHEASQSSPEYYEFVIYKDKNSQYHNLENYSYQVMNGSSIIFEGRVKDLIQGPEVGEDIIGPIELKENGNWILDTGDKFLIEDNEFIFPGGKFMILYNDNEVGSKYF